jgi:benzoate membrane transport protein
MKIKTFTADFSFSALSAGFLAVLIGFASAMAIVFQAAQAAGATQDMIVSWVWALGMGMGLGCIGLSLYYKRPIIIAWSTPGAALLVSSLNGVAIEEAIGIFIFVGVLTLLLGLSGWFDRLSKRIPLPLASAMLAGILLQFGLHIFTALKTDPIMVGSMLLVYLFAKRLFPRYAIMLVLTTGFAIAYGNDLFDFSLLSFELASPIWVSPQFDLARLIGIGIPLFIVTMSSQNIPGVAILKSSGYEQQPISPIISWTGGINLILAPFGGFAFNLAAITAAICTSTEANADPQKRYIAGVACGFFNIVAGIGAVTVVSLFAAFPTALVAALAGLALLGTIGSSLLAATAQSTYRDSAVITFLITASGVSFFGIASAFWGIVIGMLAHSFSNKD